MKKPILTLAAGFASAAFLFNTGALAGEDKHAKGDWFAKAAGDDNVLTFEEFKASKGDKMDEEKLRAKFDKMDADKDGNVTLQECEATGKKGHDKKEAAEGAAL